MQSTFIKKFKWIKNVGIYVQYYSLDACDWIIIIRGFFIWLNYEPYEALGFIAPTTSHMCKK
jgi:hypothetical protein